MPTNDQFFRLQARQNQIWRRIKEESLNIEDVLVATQDILDGKYPLRPVISTKQPSWYVSPEEQIKRVAELNSQHRWGISLSDVRPIPEFTPRTETEVLLLTISLPTVGRKSGLHRTFDELWNAIEAPTGYTKWRWDELKATTKLLRQAPGYTHTPGLRWVVFDPNAYHGPSPEAALKQSKVDNVQLAGTEVQMATLLFPDWPTSWNGTDTPYPNMSGLQFFSDSDWSRVPSLYRWDDDRRLRLNADWAVHRDDYWASPSVRECKN